MVAEGHCNTGSSGRSKASGARSVEPGKTAGFLGYWVHLAAHFGEKEIDPVT